jgi:hypothetical protein
VEYDILLKVWLPTLAVGRFAELISTEVRPTDDRNYSVIEIIRDWIWSDGAERPGPAELDRLSAATSSEEVGMVNELSESSHESQAINATTPLEVDLVHRYMSARAITTVSPTNGIPLIVRLTPTELDKKHFMRMQESVARELDRLADRNEQSIDKRLQLQIYDLSMYRCADRTLLVMCRVANEAWHLIREQLLPPLGGLAGVAQTTTYPAMSRDFIAWREHLVLDKEVKEMLGAGEAEPWVEPTESQPLLGPPLPPSVHDFLDREEDEEFEAKGSAFSPLEPWLGREVGAKEARYLKRDKGFFRETIARTAVAMLNTGGGTILIGAIEADRFAKHESEVLKVRVANLKAEDEGEEHRFLVVGLQDLIYRKQGWDGFDRKLHRELEEAVEGEITGLVRNYLDFYRERDVALMRIRYPGMTDGFYVVEGRERRFFVRQGGANRELFGKEITRYIDRKRAEEGRPRRSG